MNYLDIANGLPMWLACIPNVAIMLFCAYRYNKMSRLRALELGMDKRDCNSAFRAGIIASIGPSLANFTVMIALMAVLGGPFAWLRLSVLGSMATETIGATLGAQAAGVELGGEGYTLIPYASSVWAMSLNMLGWVLSAFLITHRMEKVKDKLDRLDTKLMSVIGTGALLGAVGYFSHANGFSMGRSGSIAVLAGMVTALVIEIIAKKTHKIVQEFNLGISMVVGMLVAQALR